MNDHHIIFFKQIIITPFFFLNYKFSLLFCKFEMHEKFISRHFNFFFFPDTLPCLQTLLLRKNVTNVDLPRPLYRLINRTHFFSGGAIFEF